MSDSSSVPATTRTGGPTALRLAPVRDVDQPVTPDPVERGPRARRPRLTVVPQPPQGTLPLVFPLPGGTPAEPDLDVRLRLTSPRHRHADPDRRDLPTPRDELPDPRPWCARLVQAAVEAAAGDRPVAQLLRWTSREVYEQLTREAAPLLARGVRRRRGTTRPVVRSMHTREPLDGVVEACATVHDGVRARAVAVRLEGLGGRWVCTALDVVR